MEKVNEPNRFKPRFIDFMYSNDKIFEPTPDPVWTYRFEYLIAKKAVTTFLNAVDNLTIPELGIESYRVITTKRGDYLGILLTMVGQKGDVRNVDAILRRLSEGLKTS